MIFCYASTYTHSLTLEVDRDMAVKATGAHGAHIKAAPGAPKAVRPHRIGNPQHTRERILEAMLALVAERGYLGASTREIAHRADVSEPTVFRLFGSKERLFEETLKHRSPLGRLREQIEAIGDMPVREAMISICTHYLEGLRERKSFIRILVSEVTTYPEKVRAAHSRLVDEIVAVLAGFIRQRQETGELREMNPEDAAQVFSKLIFSVFLTEEVMFGREMGRNALRRWAEQCVDIYLNGMLNRKGNS